MASWRWGRAWAACCSRFWPMRGGGRPGGTFWPWRGRRQALGPSGPCGRWSRPKKKAQRKGVSGKIDKNVKREGEKEAKSTVGAKNGQKLCEIFIRNPLQIPPRFSIIKLCVVVPGAHRKRERQARANARRCGGRVAKQGRFLCRRAQIIKRRVRL